MKTLLQVGMGACLIVCGSVTATPASAQEPTPEPVAEVGQAPKTVPMPAPTQSAISDAAVEQALSVPTQLTAAEAGMLDNTDPGNVEKALDIYGFSDFTFSGAAISKDNHWNGFLNRYPGMGIGNLNVYLKGNLSQRARTLIEVRFLYLPDGQQEIQADGSVKYTSTHVLDPVEVNRSLKWGGIVIERAWVEYEFHELATVRAGQFLTPYGIWNVDHGSPTIIGIRRPFVITEAIMPDKQTGIELYGRHSLSNAVLGYHLTLSNGPGVADEYQDRDANKALGGRVFGSTSAFGDLTLGFSFYTTKRTVRKEQFGLGAGGTKIFTSKDIERSQEVDVAADVKWRWQNLHLQAEWLLSKRTYDDKAREQRQTPPYVGFIPDFHRWGAYVLGGYRTPLAGIMPYLLYETATFGTGDIPRAAAVHFGLNYRPEPALVLKLEVMRAWFPGALKTSFGVDSITLYGMQVAWVF